MSALYDILAPAKINLFLHVVGRMPNGYHALQSVFMLIDWCDRLHIDTTANSVSVTIAPNDLPFGVVSLDPAATSVILNAAGQRVLRLPFVRTGGTLADFTVK
jgi:4-diphosphocytidyl-2C-methyl-D-erythritol kinase